MPPPYLRITPRGDPTKAAPLLGGSITAPLSLKPPVGSLVIGNVIGTSYNLIRRGSHAGRPQRQPTDRRYFLAFEQVSELINAVAFTNYTGHPLLVLMTLVWGHVSDFDEKDIGQFTTRLFDSLTKWLHRRGIALRAVWTRERGREKGHHLHAMVNIPIRSLYELEVHLRQAFSISKGGLDFQYGVYGMKALTRQMAALKYICKALDPGAFKYHGYEIVMLADALGIEAVGTNGPILAKRAGCTENISRRARRLAPWCDLQKLDDLAAALNCQASSAASQQMRPVIGAIRPPAAAVG